MNGIGTKGCSTSIVPRPSDAFSIRYSIVSDLTFKKHDCHPYLLESKDQETAPINILEKGIPMKKIECIIQNRKLPELEEELRLFGIGGMMVSEVKGFGKQQTRLEPYLFLPKTKVEIYCADEALDAIVKKICDICHTGQLGDGKIAILDVMDLIRVRTFERGEAAV